MDIFINGKFLLQPMSGVQRYATELVKQFDRMLEEGEIDRGKYRFVLFCPKNGINQLGLNYISVQNIGNMKGHFWEQFELPFYTSNGVLLNLCNTAPILGKKIVVTIHDASIYRVPSTYSFLFRNWYQILYMFLRRRAMVILTVSEFSKQELVDCVHIDPWKVSVISEAADNIQTIQSDEGVFAKYDIGRKPYILAVGSLSPHKNIQGVISGMAMISEQLCDLVIVGKKNKRVFNSYELPLRAGVKWVNHVSDEELKALYQRAVCLVYPSFYEGFGFPPLEAMTCGCPVIVSNVASLPEVCGDAALYCNPNNPDDIIEKVMTVLQNSNFHKELSMRGIIRSSNFSWKKTARETWQAIENKIF